MPGTYHIIHANATYRMRRVRCYETGRYHRHNYHDEEYATAACGSEVSRDRSDFCNISIATPDWNYDWCHKCVQSFPWNEEGRTKWEARGIKTMGGEEWNEWIETPEGAYVRETIERG